jgi:selenocysteine-specific elongation factor
MSPGGPLTLGTAGHVDHGKTALVAVLTGVNSDRLPQERERGLTIVLGFAPLHTPSGRRWSVVDVPGHERFVRTMVAGSTGVDAFLLVVAADDGVMPQTIEHAAVLRALGVRDGVVAISKADVADPVRATAQVRALVGDDVEIVACSARTGSGIPELVTALDRLAARTRGRSAAPGPPRLHVDRAFTVDGRGTVVTGTLWSGTIAVGDTLELTPGGRAVRVRGLQVHDEAVTRAAAGQRVAAALNGVRAREIRSGDALAPPGALAASVVLDCALALEEPLTAGERVKVHHGTREAPGRAVPLGQDLWQLRLDAPLLALDGDRVVVRRASPPATLGGGRILDAAARRHGRRPDLVDALQRRRDGRPEPAVAAPGPPPPGTSPRSAPLPGAALALETRLLQAAPALLLEADADPAALRALREAGHAVRVSGRRYAHARTVAAVRTTVLAMLERDGSVTLAALRDELGASRSVAQAHLEHLDAERLLRRLPDDRRVLARGTSNAPSAR